MMYDCVETLTKTCFFSNVQGVITTKCVMSVMKNSFFHSGLPFWSFLNFMSVHKLQARRRYEVREEEYANSVCYKMQ